MRYCQAAIHRAELRALALRHARRPRPCWPICAARCPACRLSFFGADDAPATWLAWERLDYEATLRLLSECPDHPHQFVVQG